MKNEGLFRSYELLVERADAAFHEMQKEHGPCVTCERHCSDCCHAVFGLFLIEAGYLQGKFNALSPDQKKEVLLRSNETERGIRRLQKKLESYAEDPSMQAQIMATERIRCPLLDEEGDCVLYPYRPITCRVYGIPTRIQGKARVCGKSGFAKGGSYRTFDLDEAYRYLYGLSVELLQGAGKEDPEEKASFLISLPRVMTTPLEVLIREDL